MSINDLSGKVDVLGSVSVTAGSTESYKSVFERLNALIDFTKLNDKSVLNYSGNSFHIAYVDIATSKAVFTTSSISGIGNVTVFRATIDPSNSQMYSANGVVTGASDISDTPVGNGVEVKIIY